MVPHLIRCKLENFHRVGLGILLDTYTPVAKEYHRVLETDDRKSIIVNPSEEVSDGPFTSTETCPSITSTSESADNNLVVPLSPTCNVPSGRTSRR